MKTIRVLLLLLCILLVCTAGSSVTLARTISVPGQAPTISQAIARAESGDLILVSCGTYQESNIVLKSGIKIWSGTLQPDCVTIDAGGKGRVFICDGVDTTTSVVGFTLIGGLATAGNGANGGAIWCRNASPRFTNCIIERNFAGTGGGLYCEQVSSPKLINCILRDNEATGDGGAVYWVSSGQGSIDGCTIQDNSAIHGGGIFCAQGQDLRIANTFFENNSAGNSGGGIYIKQADPVLTKTVFAGNWGGLGGGAIVCENASPEFINCTVHGNAAEYVGGGLFCRDASPRLENSIVSFNQLEAIHCIGTRTPTLTHCNLFGNADGNWSDPISHQVTLRGNISTDPLFCAPQYGNFSLNDASVCLPENNPTRLGTFIGAFGRGCASPSNQTGPQQVTLQNPNTALR